ncbi:MAG: hypothetical protein IBX56_17380 [Methylomicrobium sp.]|nr:hypothetical protein [Methylomicrobium sp.]
MKMKKILLIFCVSAMLTACASQPTTPPHWAHAVKTAQTREDHLSLAEHYDEVAKTLEANAEEERQMLREYRARPWKQGKRIHGLKSQAAKMTRDLEVAAEDSRKMAEFHRQMAEELSEF